MDQWSSCLHCAPILAPWWSWFQSDSPRQEISGTRSGSEDALCAEMTVAGIRATTLFLPLMDLSFWGRPPFITIFILLFIEFFQVFFLYYHVFSRPSKGTRIQNTASIIPPVAYFFPSVRFQNEKARGSSWPSFPFQLIILQLLSRFPPCLSNAPHGRSISVILLTICCWWRWWTNEVEHFGWHPAGPKIKDLTRCSICPQQQYLYKGIDTSDTGWATIANCTSQL